MSTQCAPATTPTGPACFPPCPTPRLRGAHDRAPETFDPDRWNSPRLPPPRQAVIPFAAGARKCIGDTYAMTEATLALATITSRWRLEHLPGQQIRPALGATLRPSKLHLRATSRSTNEQT
ncbi:cytochrome P450 [Streptomyces noursei]|uniref:cytochrome P450 n=1 Tax=Streptomyces noursei TaxID=1971 RepID=UPI0022C7A3D1|nr:cytochrome P450 [Streptomyces noursei]